MPLPDVACLCFILAISMASSAETREPSDWERLRAEGIALRQSILEAAREGDTALVATFLKGGGDPNLGPLMGDTLLIEAIRSSDPDLVALILKAGADPERRGEMGRAPLEVIAEQNDSCPEKTEVWARMRESIAESIEKKHTLTSIDLKLHDAIEKQNVEQVKEALREGASPSRPDKAGEPPLDKATRMGNAEIVALLFEAGAWLNPVLCEEVFFSKSADSAENQYSQEIKALYRKARHAEQVKFEQRMILEGVHGVREVGSHPLGYHSIYDTRIGGFGLFIGAILEGNYELCDIYLKMGADPLHETPDGQNAFDFVPKANASTEEKEALKQLLTDYMND